MTWLDEQPDDKIDRAMQAMLAALASGRHREKHCTEYAGGDNRFALWLVLADVECVRITEEVGIFDIGDFLWRDNYLAGSSPKAAAREALENDDLYASFMSEGME